MFWGDLFKCCHFLGEGQDTMKMDITEKEMYLRLPVMSRKNDSELIFFFVKTFIVQIIRQF